MVQHGYPSVSTQPPFPLHSDPLYHLHKVYRHTQEHALEIWSPAFVGPKDPVVGVTKLLEYKLSHHQKGEQLPPMERRP